MEKYWQRHEREIAEKVGGAVRPGSGNGLEKLDVALPARESWWRWVVSCKSTIRKSISVTRDILQELEDTMAIESADSRPMLALRFYDESGRHVKEDWIAITVDDWMELQEELIRARQGQAHS